MKEEDLSGRTTFRMPITTQSESGYVGVNVFMSDSTNYTNQWMGIYNLRLES